MTDNRPWTQYEDRILKFIRDDQGVQKWSTIAQKMGQQYGIKGRNGKHCKQRYMQVFDENNSVLHWDYDSQQLLFMLHDKTGNKWAHIGQQLGGRSDNDVKNHFYSKIRKGLRKLNSIIKSQFKKEFKQVKQNILYKIIQGVEDRFTASPIYDEQIWSFCGEAKNVILRMGYDQIEYNSWNDVQKYKGEIRKFIESLLFFSKDYQRKPKSVLLKKIEQHNGMQKMTQFQTNNGINQSQSQSMYSGSNYEQESQQGCFSSEDQRIGSTSNNNNNQQKNNNKKQQQNNLLWQRMKMQITSPTQQSFRGEKINSVIILKSSGDMMMDQIQSVTEIEHNSIKKSFMSIPQQLSSKQPDKSLSASLMLPSIPKLVHMSTKMNPMIDQQDQDYLPKPIKSMSRQFQQDIEFQLMKQGILEEDQDQNQQKLINKQHIYNNNIINKNTQTIKSKGSNFSSYSIEDQDCQFFTQDSTLNMRIFTTGVGGKRAGQEMIASTEKSDKLFKSLDGSGKLFQSLEWKGRKQFGMSIQKSGQMRNEDFLGHSFEK